MRPATSVGAIQRLKRRAPSFSFQLRNEDGRFSTSAPALCHLQQVGGVQVFHQDLRIQMASLCSCCR